MAMSLAARPGRANAQPALTCELITDFSRLDALAGEWTRVFEAANPPGGVFQSWPWARAFWRVHGARLSLCTPVVFEGDRLIGVVPLALRGRTARLLGDPYADYNGVLCAPEDGPRVVRLALAALLDAPIAWDTCAFNGILAGSPLLDSGPDTPEWLRVRRQQTFGYPCSATVNDGATLRKFARKHALVNKENRLKRLGRVSMRYVEDRGEILATHLDRFVELQVTRQALMGVRSPLLAREGRAMVRALVAEFDPARELRFSVLELDDRPLAYHLGFQHAGKLALYMTTFDVDFWNESPGAVLLRKAFEWAHERNLSELDFTIGDEDYKRRYANRTGETCSVHFDRRPGTARVRLARFARSQREKIRRDPARAEHMRRLRSTMTSTLHRLTHPAGLLRSALGAAWPGVSPTEVTFVCRAMCRLAPPANVGVQRLTLKEFALLRLRHFCVDSSAAEAARSATTQGQAIYQVGIGSSRYLFWISVAGGAPNRGDDQAMPPVTAIQEGLILDGSPLGKLPLALSALLTTLEPADQLRIRSRHPAAVCEAARLAGYHVVVEDPAEAATQAVPEPLAAVASAALENAEMMPGTELAAATDRDAPRSQATRERDVQALAAGQALTALWHRGDARVVDRLAEDWRHLCGEGPCDEPFLRPEWIGAHIRAFSPHRSVRLATVSAGARLRAVLPLQEERGLFCGLPARILRSPANDHSGRFDLSYGAGDAEAAIACLWEHLKATGDWDVLSLQDVPEEGGGQRLVELARRDGWPAGTAATIATPILPMAGVTDPVAAVQNAHFRQNVRRRIRKASEQFSIELVRYDRVDPDALATFYALERSGWKGHGGTAIACAPETKRFWDQAAEGAARFGYFALYVLRFDGVPVAGHFGLFHGGRYYIPKVAYDERFAAFGPGHLMIEAALGDCVARGVTLFDFVGASMSWKLEWTSRVRRHANCYIFRKGAHGRALHAAKFQIDARLRSFARRPRVARLRARLSGQPL